MSATNDGGPAFPQTPFPDSMGQMNVWPAYSDTNYGMTLRDYFAASKTILPHELEYIKVNGYAGEAFIRYRYADAMIAERNKTKE